MDLEELRKQIPTRDDLLALVEEMPAISEEGDVLEIEESLERILYPLLTGEGYGIREREPDMPAFEDALDFYAFRDAHDEYEADTVGIMFERLNRPVSVKDLNDLIKNATETGCDRCVYLSPAGVEAEAKLAAADVVPVNVELMNMDRLWEWVHGSMSDEPKDHVGQMLELTSALAHEMAMNIGLSSDALDLNQANAERFVSGFLPGGDGARFSRRAVVAGWC